MTSSAMVVCTLQRPLELGEALRAAGMALHRPDFAVVVNADSSGATDKVVGELTMQLDWEIIAVPSLPGLAHQRNVGIEFALAHGSQIDFLHFIDDDVIVSESYFQVLESVLQRRPDVVLAGGRNTAASPKNPSTVGRLIGTHSRRQGALLKSGFNTGFAATCGIHDVDWISGCSQSFNVRNLGDCRFNDRIRFYGEEVDMHVRCSLKGTIVYCADAQYAHHFSSIGRGDLATVVEWSDCARWELARRYPARFSRPRVVLTTVLHLVTALMYRTLRRESDAAGYVKGHTRFLRKILRGEDTADVPSWLIP